MKLVIGLIFTKYIDTGHHDAYYSTLILQISFLHISYFFTCWYFSQKIKCYTPKHMSCGKTDFQNFWCTMLLLFLLLHYLILWNYSCNFFLVEDPWFVNKLIRYYFHICSSYWIYNNQFTCTSANYSWNNVHL